MDKINRAAEVLSRYLLAKHLIKKRAVEDRFFNPSALVPAIRRGERVFCHFEIRIDPEMPNVITEDGQDGDLFEAIINGRNDVLDIDPGELNKWRECVLRRGIPPRCRTEC
jgi:hypothetical protein